mmetsp:Transcript_11799/g.16478  ORF Transcript_11799/g.16478 Transcript_11799/m.16478 type:complete len:204 (+) Transcript_11799:1222-1833(+)
MSPSTCAPSASSASRPSATPSTSTSLPASSPEICLHHSSIILLLQLLKLVVCPHRFLLLPQLLSATPPVLSSLSSTRWIKSIIMKEEFSRSWYVPWLWFFVLDVVFSIIIGIFIFVFVFIFIILAIVVFLIALILILFLFVTFPVLYDRAILALCFRQFLALYDFLFWLRTVCCSPANWLFRFRQIGICVTWIGGHFILLLSR